MRFLLIGLALFSTKLFAQNCNCPELPSVEASPSVIVSSFSVQVRGTIHGTGASKVSEVGVYLYSDSSGSNPIRVRLNQRGSLIQGTVSSLVTGSTYYFKLFAKNSQGEGVSELFSFSTSSSSSGNREVQDIEGNRYEVVSIGSQDWLATNLRVKKLIDNQPIQDRRSSSNWQNQGTNPSWSYPGVQPEDSVRGVLYNGWTVETEKVCPIGWRVPDSLDWFTLANYLGGYSVAGTSLKDTSSYWTNPNGHATNSSNWQGLPMGKRYWNGNTDYYTDEGYFWSSTRGYGSTRWVFVLSRFNSALSSNLDSAPLGASIRCVKDQ